MIRFRLMLATAAVAALSAGCAVHVPANRMSGAHLVLYSDLEPSAAAALAEQADNTIEDVCALLNLTPPSTAVKVVVQPSQRALDRYLREYCPRHTDAAAACFEEPDCIVIAVADQPRREDTLRSLRHECVHYVVGEYFYGVPPWLHEGLAMNFESGVPYAQLDPAAVPCLKRDLTSPDRDVLTDLVSIPAGEGLSVVGYARAWGLAYYIINDLSNGPALLVHYMGQMNAEEDAQEQFAKVFGVTPKEMEPAWREYMAKVIADKAE